MKSAEEIMEILEAFDLTQSYRDAGELAGVSHHTVATKIGDRLEQRASVCRPVLDSHNFSHSWSDYIHSCGFARDICLQNPPGASEARRTRYSVGGIAASLVFADFPGSLAAHYWIDSVPDGR